MKGHLAVAGVGLMLAGAVIVGANDRLGQGDASVPAAATPLVPVATAAITQRTIESTEEFDGTLGYAGEGVVISGMNGTFTRLPEVGDILALRDQLYEVNGSKASYLMYGSRPAWRRLDKDSSSGADVKQLEESLQELGFLDKKVKPDRKFQQKTKDAVKRWENRTNQDKDGTIDGGQVTFLPSDARITEVVPELGSPSQAGTVVARTSGTQLVVTVDLEADRRNILSVGGPVTVELPDGSESAGTVTDVDSVAQTLAGATEPTVQVTIELADLAKVGDLDGAEVSVQVVRQTRPDVLTVPVDALLALREGGYALEMVADDGSTYLVAAEVGLFDDSGVEVSGDFSAGDTVVVPT